MASLDKEIKILMLKGESGTDGKSSYDLAVEELHYSGTLEEWIESFSTPENYITRNEFKKVTQAEYDELEANHQLIPDCYYIITDDETYDDLIERIEAIESNVGDLQEDNTQNKTDIEELQGQVVVLQNKVQVLEDIIGEIMPDVEDITFTDNFDTFYNNTTSNTIPQYTIQGASVDLTITPTNSYKAIKEVTIERISGSNAVTCRKIISETATEIIFINNYPTNQYNIGSIYSPSWAGSGGYDKSTTFTVTIKTVYGTEFTHTFTLNYKTELPTDPQENE